MGLHSLHSCREKTDLKWWYELACMAGGWYQYNMYSGVFMCSVPICPLYKASIIRDSTVILKYEDFTTNVSKRYNYYLDR